ncbi:hypothetical protein B7463_g987, partial [Scytalidium lignicola]
MRNSLRRLFHHSRPLRQAGASQSSRPPNSNQTRAAMSSAATLTAIALYTSTVTKPSALGAVPEDAVDKAHHLKEGKGFWNPWPSCADVTVVDIFRDSIWARIKGKMAPDTTPPTVPVLKPEFLSSRKGSESLRATWLGHACYYVEFPGGLRVLFDPVFEDRCSPISFMGPKRFTESPCHIEDIPIIDVVVISHSHYDHLSHPTVKTIHKKHPNVQFMVGLGLKSWFKDSGITNVVEMDWWNDVDLTLTPATGEKRISETSPDAPTQNSSSENISARISCLPCQHCSARTPFDRFHTLWCSWAVESGGKKVWFGGDTGYRSVPHLPEDVDDYGPEFKDLPFCPAFKQIGDLRGPFDLGLIPIGAYDPRHLFSNMHANPFDSVNIFMDTKCKRAMGIHWGTWVLTGEEVIEPPKLLKKAMAWKGLPETGLFDVCDIGESREF